jgi:hypothetical protein
VPRIDPIDVIYELEMYPIYVTHDETEKICLFILEEDLEGYHHMDVLKESNLLIGDPKFFRLPDRYMDGDSNVRNDILRAFSATPDTDFRAFDYSIDIASTELKQQLHTLATSLGLKDKDITAAKQSAEGLFSFLEKRLSGYSLAAR